MVWGARGGPAGPTLEGLRRGGQLPALAALWTMKAVHMLTLPPLWPALGSGAALGGAYGGYWAAAGQAFNDRGADGGLSLTAAGKRERGGDAPSRHGAGLTRHGAGLTRHGAGLTRHGAGRVA